jgi:hypothetical protein
MTGKAGFTDEEWTQLCRSPMVAAMAISLADPGGPIEVVKETSAVLRIVTDAAAKRDDLVGEIAQDVRGQIKQRKNPMSDFKPRGAMAAKEILDELSRATAAVAAKATPEEAQAYRDWLIECAQGAAEAAKEGGFLGFNAVRVSEGEQKMLAEIATAVGGTAAGA